MTDAEQGICRAMTDEGIEVPIIDVTHPAFRLEMSREQIDAEMDKAVAAVRQHGAMPAEQQHAHMQLLLQSFLAPRIAAAQGTVLGGMSTYFLKLGPDNLGAYATSLDRVIAGSMPCLSCRLRLQDTARMTAEELVPALVARPAEPLNLVNIAGGPGMDSLNALIVLRREHPRLLDGRMVSIKILDVDASGPRFGSQALAALSSENGPLHGLAVRLQHVPFDWSKPSELGAILGAAGGAPGRLPAGERGGAPGIIAGSSEGGLFDYASDEQVVSSLRQFADHSPADAFFIGSLSRGDGRARLLNEAGRAAIRIREVESFSALVGAAGWRVCRVGESPLSWEVVLRK